MKMPFKIATTRVFLKEVELAKKRGKDLSKLNEVLRTLATDGKLSEKYRNHKLCDSFKDRWECHLEPDWLLIYRKRNDEIVCERTGTHSDLFN